MESPDQNRNMSGSSPSLSLPLPFSSADTPFTLTILIMFHRAAGWQISTSIDQYAGNNTCIYVTALEQDNSREQLLVLMSS